MEESLFLNPTKVIEAAGVHEGMQIADFAAGSGFFTRAAARKVEPQGTVWAVDIQQDLLPHIKHLALAEGLKNVEVIHGDVTDQDGSHLPPASFDMVIAANILFVVEDKRGLLSEINRVLKVNGRALLIDWSGSYGGLGPHPKHVVTSDSAQSLCKEGGFSVIQDIPAGAYHWGFMVRKKS